MVLMTAISSSGKRGRCDARCYRGKATTKCRCICGGNNHAQGLERSLENVRRAVGLPACAHCGHRLAGAEGTIWCAPCLEELRRAYVREMREAHRDFKEVSDGYPDSDF